ncbi:MAG: hypothetical protein C4K49_07560 [Candidatus Thorarchaeota archaeon]|nr:MAG: hypothetical protein C4K49_07560 [Candidatus Thorarchaeota archaeon]
MLQRRELDVQAKTQDGTAADAAGYTVNSLVERWKEVFSCKMPNYCRVAEVPEMEPGVFDTRDWE